jgi:hypothetical protein
MVRDQVRRILVSRGAPFNDEAMEDRSEYMQADPRSKIIAFRRFAERALVPPAKPNSWPLPKIRVSNVSRASPKARIFFVWAKAPDQPRLRKQRSRGCLLYQKRSFSIKSWIFRLEQSMELPAYLGNVLRVKIIFY